MEIILDSLNEFISSMGWLVRTTFNGVVWATTGQFIPSSCTWCRPAWMIGLAMGLVLIVTYAKGPRTD